MYVFVFIAIPLSAIYIYYKWSFNYWKRKNLPYLSPKIPYGNLTSPFRPKEHLGVTMQKVYKKMKSEKWKHGGIFFMISPVYFVVDLDCVKNVMTKNFHHFSDRGSYYNEKDDPLSANLAAIGGSKWQNLKAKIRPTFTSVKMKMIYQTMIDCEANLQKRMLMEYHKKEPLEVKNILECFTTDINGSVVFGLDCNAFQKENSPFRVYGKKAFTSTTFKTVKTNFTKSYPNFARKLGVLSISRDISRFFLKVVKDTVNYREKNNYTRNDFLQLLIDLKNNDQKEKDGYKNDEKSLTIEEIAAQCYIFFLAGFETSSTTMTFALYELAKHPEIQDKVREEIETVLAKHGGKITYEAIHDLKYMGQVIDETLRKYPPVPFLTRECVQDYQLPDEDVVIEKGTTVVLPVLGIHYDKEYYPNPEKFDPERFTEENKNSRHHYAHIPFGEGPRICIGIRFGLLQTKVGLTSLLKTYKFKVSKKTQEPLKMKVSSFVLAVEGEVFLDAEKL